MGSQQFRHRDQPADSPGALAWNMQENLPLFDDEKPELKIQLAERLRNLATTDKLVSGH
jgi:hypothetical protein